MTATPRDDNHVPAIFGVSSADGTTPVTIYVDPTTHRLEVEGVGINSIDKVSVEITRAANTTAYAAGDIVGAAAVIFEIEDAASYAAGSGYIVGMKVSTDKKSITPRFKLHFFNAATPTLSADNAAYQSLYADLAKQVFSYEMPAMSTPTDTTNSTMSEAEDYTMRVPFECAAAATSLWVAIETLDGFDPASGEKITITLMVDQN